MAALVIDWDDGPNARLRTQDIARELEQATLNPGPVAQSVGDADEAMARAATRIEATYQVPFLAHAAMEPMNCTVDVRKNGCEVWIGSQVIARVQAAAAKTAGLPLDKVVVHNHLIGGGFGRRLEVDGVVRRSRRADRAACRRSGEGHLDPRRRHPARHVPALFLRPDICRPRWEWNARRLEASLRRLVGARAMAPAGFQQGPRPRHD